MAGSKSLKKWALFAIRWGIAIVGIWIVFSRMSLRDRAWVVGATGSRPVLVNLYGDDATRKLPLMVNEPYTTTAQVVGANGGVQKLVVLGLDLQGDINKNPRLARMLVADDAKTGPARWVDPIPGYEVKVPYPKVQVGLIDMIKAARPSLLWAALLVFPITFIITSYRWHELLKVLDIHMGIGQAFALNMVGCFYNSFMPGSTGGDAIKAYQASKMTPHRTRAVMSVLVDRAVGLLALIIVGGTTASFQLQIPECRRVAIAAAAICACFALGCLVFYHPTLHRVSGLEFFLRKLPMQKQVRGAVDAMRLYGRRPALSLWSLVISLPVHGAVVTSAMLAGLAFGLPLHWTYYWVAVPVIVLAGALPISPQGAGVMEGFAVLLTRGQGVTISQAFALTMSIRVIQIIWNLAGGVFALGGRFKSPDSDQREAIDPTHSLPDGPGGEPAVSV